MKEKCPLPCQSWPYILSFLPRRERPLLAGKIRPKGKKKTSCIKQRCNFKSIITGANRTNNLLCAARLYTRPALFHFLYMISQPVLMNSNLYYLLMTLVYFLNTVTWMYLPPILTTSSTMFQLGCDR